MCYLRTSRQWVDYSALVTDGDAAPHDQSTEGQSGSIHPPPPPPSPTLDWCARGRAVCCDCRCSSPFRRSSGPTVTAVGTVAQFRSVRRSIGHPVIRPLRCDSHSLHMPCTHRLDAIHTRVPGRHAVGASNAAAALSPPHAAGVAARRAQCRRLPSAPFSHWPWRSHSMRMRRSFVAL